ncbi:MAG: PP2C family protein-serine/threonine phosphatase [Planctomycetota bacterium]
MAHVRSPATEAEGVKNLARLFRDGSQLTEPSEMLRHFGGYFGRLRPSPFFMSVSCRGLREGEFKITRRLTNADRNAIEQGERPPANPWRDWDRLTLYQGGFIADVIAAGEPQVICDLDLAFDPAIGDTLVGYRACMAVPYYDDGKPLNWSMWFYDEPQGPTADILERTLLDTNMLGMSTRNLVTRREAETLAERLQAEFEKIATIQQQLLPQKKPPTRNVKIATSYLTSVQAGGDYYDWTIVEDGRLGLLIADVAGHGPAAATVMAMLRAIIHCYDEVDPTSNGVVDFTNRQLLESNLVGNFATAFFVLIDMDEGHIESSLCGHNPPRLRRLDGEIVKLDEAGTFPLGVTDELDAHPACRQMLPGETLVLYTDGITEAFRGDGDHREMFGEDRLDAAIARSSGAPQDVIDSIQSAVYEFTGSVGRDDDQTLVVMQFCPDEGGAC